MTRNACPARSALRSASGSPAGCQLPACRELRIASLTVTLPAARTGVTRFPVRDGDTLVGYLRLQDTLGTPPNQRAGPLPARYIRPLPELSADLALPDALERMRGGKAPIAQVAADGASRGIATLDDLLARLIRS